MRKYKRITYHRADEPDRPYRSDGPAVIKNNTNGRTSLKWYTKDPGKKHREDGPAIIHDDGYCEWYLNGFLAGSASTSRLSVQPPERFKFKSATNFEDKEYTLKDWVPKEFWKEFDLGN